MAGITQLFGDLCAAHMTDSSLKVCLDKRKINQVRAKRDLKKVVYGTLFTNLFQEDARKLQSKQSKLPVKNKMLMLSFDLRVCGRGEDAERLEELVEQLEQSTCLPLNEISSVLELLVQLAGTGPPQAHPPKRDYFRNNKYVGRHPKYQGYDYYDVSMFEADARMLIANEECQISDTIMKTIQIMESAPGSGLTNNGFFSQNYPVRDRFEKETRISLFGALIHSRTSDIDIKLDLPPVPDSADLSGLAIKVPQSMDQSDDEGFQSASNLTPDSQSEPSMTPDIDLWHAVLNFAPSKRRCWERIGCPPGKKEEPYLTEAGRETFDQFYRFREGELQILCSATVKPPQLVMLKEIELVKDVLNAFIGVVSSTFSFSQPSRAFVAKQGIYISGTTPESMSNLLSQVAEYGTLYTSLCRFSVQPVLDSSYNKGLVFQAFTSGLRKYLQYYRACVLSTPPTLSILTISFVFRKLGRQLRYLAELCCVGTAAVGATRASSTSFPFGVKLLSYLYKEAIENCSNEYYPVLLSLLKTCCEPYTRFVYDWVYSGVFRDVYGEFMIKVNEDFLRFRDRSYWTHGYVLISKEVEDCVPVFLKHIANEIYMCGKTINLLKLCCPMHYICWSEIPVPRIAVTFSLEELKEMEKDCAVYMGRVERLARYSCISREEKDLKTEIAKQELIIRARQMATQALEAFKDRQMSNKMALDAKKREQFQRLKDQFEKDKERRLAAKQEDAEDGFSYAKELSEREKRLKAIEQDLERKTRQELIEHYSKLSEEAARKEQRSLWKIQRHRLETARLRFLSEDKNHIKKLLEKHFRGENSRELRSDSHPPVEKLLDLCTSRNAGVQPQQPSKEAEYIVNSSSKNNEEFPLESGAASEESLLFLNSNDTIEFSDSVLSASPLQSAGTTALSDRCFLDVSIEDILSKSILQPAATASQDSAVDEALQDIESELLLPAAKETEGISTSEALQLNDYDFNTVIRPTGFTPASQGHVQMGENVPNVQLSMPCWNIHGHASEASIKIGNYISDIELVVPLPNSQRHASDSHIKLGEYSSSVEPSRPRWNVHGHVSSAHIKVGEYASDIEAARPQLNIHGHASDANIRIGENVSNVEPSRPRWNIHGHVSKSSIVIGENVSNVESSQPHLNMHGYETESYIKTGELVLDTADSNPRSYNFGHVSQSSFQIGTWSLAEETNVKAYSKSIYGHSSDSTAQNVMYGGQSSVPLTKIGSNGTEEDYQPPLQPMLQADGPSCLEDEREQRTEVLETSARKYMSSALQREEPCNLFREESLTAAAQKLTAVTFPLDNVQQSSPKTNDMPETEDGAIVDGLMKEQGYRKLVAEKYCIEKYQDKYDLMSEPPVLDLMSHGMPRPCYFPDDPYVKPGTDETTVQLLELLSLPVLMKYSVTSPLASHVSLVNKAIVDYYFVGLEIEKHFGTLRHFLLMEDGEFAQSLSDLLFEKLGSGQTPGELLNPLVLNSVLNKALQYSLHGDSQLAENLSFALKYLPEMFKSNAPDALSCLELRYKVDWPLNIVITETCMNTYNKIFSFLLQLKHMVWSLRDIYFHLKRTALVNCASNSTQYRQLQLYRHEMQHLVKVIQGYIANQILHVTWCEFLNKLSAVVNLEDIHTTHEEYLQDALFRGLLTDKAASVMSVIHSIFSLVLTFRIQLISQAWSFDSEMQMAVHPNFGLMQKSYNNFKFYSVFLFDVVAKLVNRGFQPHLEDFILRLNFNNYYKKPCKSP